MEASTINQKQLKDILKETSRFFKNLCSIMEVEGFEEQESLVSKKGRGKVEKGSKGDIKDGEKNGGRGGKGKKQKKYKDPNAPKKPLTAFMLYTNKRRPEVMKTHQGLKITEISTIIGKEWKELTKEEKDIWKEKHQEEKLMYELKLFNYKKDGKGDEAEGAGEANVEVKKSSTPVENKQSTMNSIAGAKREKSGEDDSSIDSSSDDEEAKNNSKRQKTE
mmetsp:Transcript_13424/g.15074  ORF Transcript_13424/g.15074 Transcript_13424/m.15074 type:complete len:220 (+) Transcript_13424:16-675(+)